MFPFFSAPASNFHSFQSLSAWIYFACLARTPPAQKRNDEMFLNFSSFVRDWNRRTGRLLLDYRSIFVCTQNEEGLAQHFSLDFHSHARVSRGLAQPSWCFLKLCVFMERRQRIFSSPAKSFCSRRGENLVFLWNAGFVIAQGVPMCHDSCDCRGCII